MATRIMKSFFLAPEVILVGYSQRHEAFCESVRTAFEKKGTRVFPVNPRGTWGSVEVYESIDKVPSRPEFACVLTSKANSVDLVDQLVAHGVKRVAFGSGMSADKALLDTCREKGLEAVIACPMMALGSGFHRFHGWLAGVR